MNVAIHVAIQHAAQRQAQANAHLIRHIIRQNGRWAALAPLHDRHVADVTSLLLASFGIASSARLVVLGIRVQRHILERRRLVAREDAKLAAHHISSALSDIRYRRVSPRPGFTEVIGYVQSLDRYLLVVVKSIESTSTRSKLDELWIQTAYPVGTRRLRKGLAKRDFVAIESA